MLVEDCSTTTAAVGPNPQSDQTPSGKCLCGCGQTTPIATETHKKRGRIKGQPCRFVSGHTGRKRIIDPQFLIPPNPTGHCFCGCGEITPLAVDTRPGRYLVKGQHARYVSGHNVTIGPNPVRHLPSGVSVIEIIHKGEKLECLVDTTDYPLVAAYRWVAWRRRNTTTTFYARAWKLAKGRRRFISMHNLILPGRGLIDHRFGNGLDNRRGSLRFCTPTQNNANRRKLSGCSSIYKGVSRGKRSKKFVAQIGYEGKHMQLGSFAIEEHAAHAYDRAAVKFFGEFAKTNFEQKPGLGARCDFDGPVAADFPQKPGPIKATRHKEARYASH
jgi:hypothetical protein